MDETTSGPHKIWQIENIQNADIKLLNLQYKIGQFLGVTPQNMEKHDRFKVLKQCHIFGLLLMVPLLMSYTFYRKSHFFGSITMHRAILNGAESLAEFFFLFRCLLGALKMDINKWKNLVNTLNKVEAKLKSENFSVKINTTPLILEIVFYHLVSLALITFELYVSSIRRPLYFTHKICQYYQLFEIIFICNITKMLRKRYNFLSKIIKDFLKTPVFIVSKHEDQIRKEKLRNVFSVYQYLYIITQEFENIFGWQIFLILICTVFSLLNHANRAFLVFKSKEGGDDTEKYLIHGLFYPAIYVLTTVFLVMSCDAVEKSGFNVIATCHRKLIYLENTSLRFDLQMAAKFMEKIKPAFSAAGFFQINQLVLATIFTSVTTYIIIIIQFE